MADAWLSWPGRAWTPGQQLPAGSDDRDGEGEGDAEIITTELAGAGEAPPDRARLIQGDSLEIAHCLVREGWNGKIDLVYVDPPFASQATYVHEARLDGPADGRVLRARAYDDTWRGGLASYLEMIAPRIEALAGLLSERGTIWVHVDWRASYLLRLLLDEILGRAAFKNEIVWRRAPNLGRQAASHQFGRTLDTIVVYGGKDAKLVPPTRLEPVPPSAVRWDEKGCPFTTAPRGDYTDESIHRLEQEGRVYRAASGKAYVKYFLIRNAEGRWCRQRRVDALWTDISPLRHAPTTERTGFPTQKPRALVDRIIQCASPPNGLVVDLFAGSGTTGESAHALGRRFILGDESPLAMAIARARLLRAGITLTIQACQSARASNPEHKGDGELRVAVQRDGTMARIELLEPREPLAWAVDTAFDPFGPFRAAWHSERIPSGRTVRAALTQITLGCASGTLAVRVWQDDGRVATRVLEGT